MKKFIPLFTALGTLTLGLTAFAYTGDISISESEVTFSDNNFLEGKVVRIYANATNNSSRDLLGVVRFFDNNNQIGADQPVSIYAGKTDGVFLDWKPNFGNHTISVKVSPWEPENDNPGNNSTAKQIFVVQDTDYDGTPNETDADDDNDGVPDKEDHYPLDKNEQFDTDGDGKGNSKDDDDDNDGVPDSFDEMPLDPTETIDTDKDGVGNISDTDDDNDTLFDTDEDNSGTDPLKMDTDEDTVNDNEDAFPLDPNETLDTDTDKIGNKTDIDDDNDGIKDEEDEFPLNKGPFIKLANEDMTVGFLDEQIFDATPSFDEDGEIVSYIWEIDGRKIKEGNFIKYAFKEVGDHNLKLTITDNNGESRTTEYQVKVLNISLYKEIAFSILALLLAVFIYIKYIAGTKNSKKQ